MCACVVLESCVNDLPEARIRDRRLDQFFLSVALKWLTSYLADRVQFTKIDKHSSLVTCLSGVPQRSVRGPLLFAVYVSPIDGVISSHGVHYHQYTDNTQLYQSMRACGSDTGLTMLVTFTLSARTTLLNDHSYITRMLFKNIGCM